MKHFRFKLKLITVLSTRELFMICKFFVGRNLTCYQCECPLCFQSISSKLYLVLWETQSFFLCEKNPTAVDSFGIWCQGIPSISWISWCNSFEAILYCNALSWPKTLFLVSILESCFSNFLSFEVLSNSFKHYFSGSLFFAVC